MRRYTIRNKLILGIGTILLLAAILSMYSNRLEQEMMLEHETAENYLMNVNSLKEAKESHLSWYSNLKHVFLYNESSLEEFDESECQLGKWYNAYFESDDYKNASPDFKRIILDLELQHSKLHSSVKEVISRWQDGNHQEAKLLFKTNVMKAEDNLITLMNEVEKSLLNVASTSTSRSNMLFYDSKNLHKTSIVVLILVSIIISFFLIRTTVIPISRFIKRIREMNTEEIYETIDDIHAKDEISDLIVVFNRMVNKVNNQQIELQEQNEELIAQGEELTAQNEEFIQQQDELQEILIKLTNQEERLNRLYSFSQMLNHTIDLDELMDNALRGLLDEGSAQVGGVMLFDEESKELRTTTSFGLLEDQYLSSLKLGEGLAGRAAIQRRALIANYGYSELRSQGLNGKLSMVSEIYLPLIIQGRLLGVAILGRLDTKPFDETEKKFLTALCDQIAVALDNALTHLETQKALNQVQELDRLKSEMINTVSHELRTPLASILGFSELLLVKRLDLDKSKKYLSTIYNESKRLKNLINDFLDLQKIENGKLEYVKKQVDLVELLRSSLEIYQGQKKHTLELKVNDDLRSVSTDPDRLQQVMGNLLSNAIKYSPLGGKIEVNISRNSDNQVEISVKDEGLGIPEEAQQSLFQPFFRVDNSDRRQIGGTGLGLAICRRIVQALGGDIWVKSIHGHGSTFTFSLPI